MFNNIITKTLYEKRWMLIGWSIGLAATAVLTMSLYPSFNQQGIDQIIGSVPESLRSLVGDVSSYKTIPGFIAQQIYGPQIPIFTIILAIMLFYGLSAGDEDRGTLETLLAQPVSRTKVYFHKFFAASAILLVMVLFIAIGVLIGLAIIGESTSLLRLTQASFACYLMTVAYGMVAYAIGTATGKKGLAIAIASIYAFLSFFISSLAPAVKALRPIEKGSLFYYYNSPQTMVVGLDWRNMTIIIVSILVMMSVSLVFFKNRDLVRGD